MICVACGRDNREAARFCDDCGELLTSRCPVCEQELRSDARFCDACGTPVAASVADPVAPARSTGSRKVVTLVFADLAGSTSLQERMDAESVRRAMDRFYDAMRAAVAEHGGTVVKFMGDGLMAAFGVPAVAEDDAVRAVRAAAAMQEAFVAVADEVRRERDAHVGLRVGVNTGEVVVAEGEDDVVGDAVNVAARLEHAAAEGQVLVGHETWRLTRDLFTFEEVPPLDLKGKSQRVAAYRLVTLAPPAADEASPFVGRGEELTRLTAAFEAAVEERRARLVTVIGSPGLGKSRMVRELSRRLAGRAVTYEGQCEASGSSTFAPVADVLRAIAGIDETASGDDAVTALAALFPDGHDDAGRIAPAAASVLGVGRGVSPEETFWAVRRVIEQTAGGQPVIVVFDDVHWAEPILLDLLEHLAEWIRDAPVLLVALARPEIRDVRAALADTAATPIDVVVLDALAAEEGVQLAAELLEGHPLHEDVAAHLLTSAEGNPLFLRELVKMLVDDSVLHIENGVWVAADGVEELEVPPTIHALLSARIERLESDERSVVERASVVGHQFFRGAVAVLSRPPVAKQIDTHLETLRRKEVVEPEGTYWIDEPVFRFHHALIRDAAYRRLLKEARAELHERVADWLATKAGDLVGEHEEIIGYHLEQAYEYRRDLDGVDGDVSGLGRRAADHLAAAARRSLDRDDQRSASALMARALACLPPGDSSRAELLVDRCEALLGMGQIAAGAEAVAELEAAAAGEPRLAAWTETFAAQIASFSEPEALPDWVDRAAAAADRLEELGDAVGTAKASAVHASILARLGRVAACEAALDRALAAAREAGDRRRANGVLAGAPLAALWGPSPVTRAAGRCLDVVRVLRITTDSPPVEAVALRAQGVLEAFRGRFEAARRLLASSRKTLEELGLRHGILQTDLFEGLVELAADEFTAAEAALRRAYDGFRALGVDVDAGQAGALLARACLAQGRDDEALELTYEIEQLGGHDLKTAIVWRAVRAEALARRGETDEALRLSREAVHIAGNTDALIDHADARLALASVLEAAGDTAAAEEEAQRAAELYEAKGATALAERARSLVGTVSPHPTTTEQPVHQPHGHDPALTNLATAAFETYTRLAPKKDVDGIVALVAPDYVMEERRRAAQTTISGHDGVRQVLDVMFEVDFRLEYEVLATRLDRLSLVRVVAHGRDPLGGAAEFRLLRVDETNDRGVLVHTVTFDSDDLDTALDELDERFIAHVDPACRPILELSRANRHAYNGHDFDAMRLLLADDAVFVDHRPSGWGALDADAYIERLRGLIPLAEHVRIYSVDCAVLRPEAVLGRMRSSGIDTQGGHFEVTFEYLATFADGKFARVEFFDPAERPRALARFDELTGGAETEPANLVAAVWERYRELFPRGDIDGILATVSPDYVLEERQYHAQHTSVGREGYRKLLAAIFEGEFTRVDGEVLAARGARLALVRVAWQIRAQSGGDFEVVHLRVDEADDHGLLTRTVVFDADDLDAAYDELDQRFDELAERLDDSSFAKSLAIPAWFERGSRATEVGDLDGLLALMADDVTYEERTRTSGLFEPLRGKEAIADLYSAVFTGRVSFPELEMLATRGPRLVLTKATLRWTDGVGQTTEHAHLRLDETDEAGLIVSSILFEADDLDAAFDELDERYLAHVDPSYRPILEVSTARRRALNARDWDGLRALLADDYVHVSDPLTAAGVLGERDATTLLGQLAELVSQAPDHRWYDVEILRLTPDGAVLRGSGFGTGPQGIRYETATYALEMVRTGKIWRAEIFHESKRAAALARFDELTAGQGADLHAGNLALEAEARTREAVLAGDLEGVLAVISDDITYEERTRTGTLAPLEGKDALVDIYTRVLSGDTMFQAVEVLATRGDRLALHKATFSWRDDSGTETEHHHLRLDETDGDGRIVTTIFFEAHDMDAAFDELDERFRAHVDPACRPMVELSVAMRHAYNERDWDRFRSHLADEFVVVDHRPAGWGEIDADAYLDHIRGLMNLADVRLWIPEVARIRPRAILSRSVVAGTGPEEGTVEFPMDLLGIFADGRWQRFELFDASDHPHALARFDELTAEEGPWTDLVNDATRTWERQTDLMLAPDVDAMLADIAEDIVYEERMRVPGRFTLTGHVEVAEMLSSMLARRGPTAIETEVLVIRGEHLALTRNTFRWIHHLGGPTEYLNLRLDETDEAGLITSVVTFEPDDLDAAFEELEQRYLDGLEPASRPVFELAWASQRSFNYRDWDALRATVADDSRLVDRRLVGYGERDGKQYVEGMRAMVDMAPDVRSYTVEIVRLAPTVILSQVRTSGTDGQGGRFEQVIDSLGVLGDGRLRLIELFDPAQRDQALARFDDLVAGDEEPELVNDAVRLVERANERIQAQDIDGE